MATAYKRKNRGNQRKTVKQKDRKNGYIIIKKCLMYHIHRVKKMKELQENRLEQTRSSVFFGL